VANFSTRLQAGKLRHRIDIVAPTNAQDSTGGISKADNIVYANVWAAIEAVTTKDTLATAEFISQSTHKVTIRYVPGVTARMQVWFNGRVFQIAGVMNPDERTKQLVLWCLEINDSAQQQTAQSGDLT
jgi:SPP1 family predicted phage head-tail adaptor